MLVYQSVSPIDFSIKVGRSGTKTGNCEECKCKISRSATQGDDWNTKHNVWSNCMFKIGCKENAQKLEPVSSTQSWNPNKYWFIRLWISQVDDYTMACPVQTLQTTNCFFFSASIKWTMILLHKGLVKKSMLLKSNIAFAAMYIDLIVISKNPNI